jgi:hypothetical protein
MWFTSLFSNRARAARRRGRRYRPQVETLEDRRLLTTLIALTDANSLLTFDSSAPAAATTTTITGLAASESLQAIAVRPSTGQLYALSVLHLYTVDLASGAATPVGDPKAVLGFDASLLAMSFDPVADRLRVIAEQVVDKTVVSAQNLTLSPETGLVVSTGTAPQYVAGDINAVRIPRLSRLAYTNQVAGATTATLYGIDDKPIVPDNLITLGGPNGMPSADTGQVFSVASVNSSDAFAIAGADNTAFALAANDQNASQLDLFTMSLTNGTATLARSAVATGVVTGLAALPVSSATAPTPAFSINDVTVAEPSKGTVNAVFAVSLSTASTQPVSVRVNTLDGTALAPAEYQPFPPTTLTFTPGQTSQLVTIPVDNNGLFGGVETFFVELSAPTNAMIVKGQGVGTITNSPVVMPSDDQIYVDGLYQAFLGRFPDPAGQAAWQSLLDAGVSRSTVATAIQQSGEYAVNQVEELYAKLLHRPADMPGLNAGLASMARGVTAQGLEAAMLGSAEYFANHGGTIAGFLAGVYQDELQRAIEPSAAQAWAAALAAGNSRALVAGAILGSAESIGNLVQSHYRHFLRHNADPQGLQYWTSIVLSAGDAARASALAGLDGALVVSGSFQTVSGTYFLNRGFVIKVYHDLLERTHPSDDPAGLAFWEGLLDSGQARDLVVEGIEGSAEFITDYITSLARDLTGVDPDPNAVQMLVGPIQASLGGSSRAFTFDNVREQIFESGPTTGFHYAPDSTFDQAWLNKLIMDALGRPFGSALSRQGFDEDGAEAQQLAGIDPATGMPVLPPPAPAPPMLVVQDVLYGNMAQQGLYMDDHPRTENVFDLEHLAFLAPKLETKYLGAGVTPDPQEQVTNLHFGDLHFGNQNLDLFDHNVLAFSDAKNEFTFFADGGVPAPALGPQMPHDGEPQFIANVVGTSAYFPKA